MCIKKAVKGDRAREKKLYTYMPEGYMCIAKPKAENSLECLTEQQQQEEARLYDRRKQEETRFKSACDVRAAHAPPPLQPPRPTPRLHAHSRTPAL